MIEHSFKERKVIGMSRETPVWNLPSEAVSPELIDAIAAGLKDLRYGALEIVVHDGRVVQIERREKFKWNAEPVAKFSRS